LRAGGESRDPLACVCDAGGTPDVNHTFMKTIIVLIALAFSACNSVHSNSNVTTNKPTTPSPAPVAHQAHDNVRRVTTTELDDLMKQGKVVVVDVRDQQSYDAGHIRGSKWISVTQIGERYKELPRDKMIVAYCA